jgi:DnaK suppressor protein
MEANQRRQFQRTLEEMLKRLTGELDPLVESVRDESQIPGEHDDKPSQAIDRQLVLEQNEEALVFAVRSALTRIDAGTFGKCQSCGREISLERLKAVPYAAYCVECQKKQDRGETAAVSQS